MSRLFCAADPARFFHSFGEHLFEALRNEANHSAGDPPIRIDHEHGRNLTDNQLTRQPGFKIALIFPSLFLYEGRYQRQIVVCIDCDESNVRRAAMQSRCDPKKTEDRTPVRSIYRHRLPLRNRRVAGVPFCAAIAVHGAARKRAWEEVVLGTTVVSCQQDPWPVAVQSLSEGSNFFSQETES